MGPAPLKPIHSIARVAINPGIEPLSTLSQAELADVATAINTSIMDVKYKGKKEIIPAPSKDTCVRIIIGTPKQTRTHYITHELAKLVMDGLLVELHKREVHEESLKEDPNQGRGHGPKFTAPKKKRRRKHGYR